MVGVYLPTSQRTDMFVRIAFIAQALGFKNTPQDPDNGVIDSDWFTLSESRHFEEHRSPLVLDCIEDYISGRQILGLFDSSAK